MKLTLLVFLRRILLIMVNFCFYFLLNGKPADEKRNHGVGFFIKTSLVKKKLYRNFLLINQNVLFFYVYRYNNSVLSLSFGFFCLMTFQPS